MQPSAAYVEVALATPAQNEQVCQVDGEASTGDQEHQTTLDLRRVGQAFPGFARDQTRQGNERGTVDKGRQDFGPMKAVGALPGGGTLGQHDRHQRQPQCGGVREHVPCVREQGQGIGCEATHDFGNHVRGSQHQGHGESPPIALDLSGGGVMVMVLMAHLDSLLATPPNVERSSATSL